MLELVFLGTSAATPTKRRNVSSLIVQTHKESLLIDAGEGTQLQIIRSGLRRGRIDRILITHLHGDHFYGLIGLLTSFQLNKREEPLHLYGPPGLVRYIDFMKKLSQTAFSYDLQITELPDTRKQRLVFENSDYQVWAGQLKHRVYTIGYRIQEQDKPGKFDADLANEMGVPHGPERRKLIEGQDLQLENGDLILSKDLVGQPHPGASVAICFDTAKCDMAVELAKNADLLVHETTFNEDDPVNAKRTMHSTTRDAAECFEKSGAGNLAITHFSTRYLGDISPIVDSIKSMVPKAVIAKDFMSLKFNYKSELEVTDSRSK
jgi:ribonuclease Z